VSGIGVITGNWKPRRDSNPRLRFRKRYIAGLDDTGRHQASSFSQSRSQLCGARPSDARVSDQSLASFSRPGCQKLAKTTVYPTPRSYASADRFPRCTLPLRGGVSDERKTGSQQPSDYPYLPSVYRNASTRCAAPPPSSPARSAIVWNSLRMRGYAPALRQTCVIAVPITGAPPAATRPVAVRAPAQAPAGCQRRPREPRRIHPRTASTVRPPNHPPPSPTPRAARRHGCRCDRAKDPTAVSSSV
jgi:hypothetical protein